MHSILEQLGMWIKFLGELQCFKKRTPSYTPGPRGLAPSLLMLAKNENEVRTSPESSFIGQAVQRPLHKTSFIG